VKKESTKAFEARIKNAHTLSKFLFDHVKAEVDFNTIEGKTLFLEKVSVLINQVNYEIYQQQLIEGLAQVVGQSIDQVQAIFQQQTAQTQTTPFDTIPVIDDEPPIPHSDWNQPPKPAPAQSSAVKALMSRMISLLLNYPVLADGTVEVRVRKIEKSQVLLELIHSAQIDGEISQEDLIKPFESKTIIYNRLQQLCTLEPHLSEKQARDEFLSALTAAEKRQENAQIKASIASANTTEEQQKIMEGIQKGKFKS
jgi:DNA primase